MHYGLLPRANRGIFAINELPDLAGKIQVGLFNILQEGDVQIKGYPVRLRLDVLMAFTANPEDYTARGKIITPLKDRIGSEIRTHYAATRHQAMAITAQEAWIDRASTSRRMRGARATCARWSRKWRSRRAPSGGSTSAPASASACRSRVLENVASNAERRALAHRRSAGRRRDRRTSTRRCPSITGKFELEYEGELRGADTIARELIRAAVANVFLGYLENAGHAHGRGLVRQRRHAAVRRHARRRPTLLSTRGTVPGLLDADAHRRRRADRAGASARVGRRTSSSRASYATKRISRATTAATRRPKRSTAPQPPAARRSQTSTTCRRCRGQKKYLN